ncbi:MAG: hypothetical protein ABIG89_07290 [Candidatus Woesearchaeota archaeon]
MPKKKFRKALIFITLAMIIVGLTIFTSPEYKQNSKFDSNLVGLAQSAQTQLIAGSSSGNAIPVNVGDNLKAGKWYSYNGHIFRTDDIKTGDANAKLLDVKLDNSQNLVVTVMPTNDDKPKVYYGYGSYSSHLEYNEQLTTDFNDNDLSTILTQNNAKNLQTYSLGTIEDSSVVATAKQSMPKVEEYKTSSDVQPTMFKTPTGKSVYLCSGKPCIKTDSTYQLVPKGVKIPVSSGSGNSGTFGYIEDGTLKEGSGQAQAAANDFGLAYVSGVDVQGLGDSGNNGLEFTSTGFQSVVDVGYQHGKPNLVIKVDSNGKTTYAKRNPSGVIVQLEQGDVFEDSSTLVVVENNGYPRTYFKQTTQDGQTVVLDEKTNSYMVYQQGSEPITSFTGWVQGDDNSKSYVGDEGKVLMILEQEGVNANGGPVYKAKSVNADGTAQSQVGLYDSSGNVVTENFVTKSTPSGEVTYYVDQYGKEHVADYGLHDGKPVVQKDGQLFEIATDNQGMSLMQLAPGTLIADKTGHYVMVQESQLGNAGQSAPTVPVSFYGTTPSNSGPAGVIFVPGEGKYYITDSGKPVEMFIGVVTLDNGEKKFIFNGQSYSADSHITLDGKKVVMTKVGDETLYLDQYSSPVKDAVVKVGNTYQSIDSNGNVKTHTSTGKLSNGDIAVYDRTSGAFLGADGKPLAKGTHVTYAVGDAEYTVAVGKGGDPTKGTTIIVEEIAGLEMGPPSKLANPVQQQAQSAQQQPISPPPTEENPKDVGGTKFYVDDNGNIKVQVTGFDKDVKFVDGKPVIDGGWFNDDTPLTSEQIQQLSQVKSNQLKQFNDILIKNRPDSVQAGTPAKAGAPAEAGAPTEVKPAQTQGVTQTQVVLPVKVNAVPKGATKISVDHETGTTIFNAKENDVDYVYVKLSNGIVLKQPRNSFLATSTNSPPDGQPSSLVQTAPQPPVSKESASTAEPLTESPPAQHQTSWDKDKVVNLGGTDYFASDVEGVYIVNPGSSDEYYVDSDGLLVDKTGTKYYSGGGNYVPKTNENKAKAKPSDDKDGFESMNAVSTVDTSASKPSQTSEKTTATAQTESPTDAEQQPQAVQRSNLTPEQNRRLLNARSLYTDSGNYNEAAKEFEKLFKETGRLGILYQAAIARKMNGDNVIAKDYFLKILKKGSLTDELITKINQFLDEVNKNIENSNDSTNPTEQPASKPASKPAAEPAKTDKQKALEYKPPTNVAGLDKDGDVSACDDTATSCNPGEASFTFAHASIIDGVEGSVYVEDDSENQGKHKLCTKPNKEGCTKVRCDKLEGECTQKSTGDKHCTTFGGKTSCVDDPVDVVENMIKKCDAAKYSNKEAGTDCSGAQKRMDNLYDNLDFEFRSQVETVFGNLLDDWTGNAFSKLENSIYSAMCKVDYYNTGPQEVDLLMGTSITQEHNFAHNMSYLDKNEIIVMLGGEREKITDQYYRYAFTMKTIGPVHGIVYLYNKCTSKKSFSSADGKGWKDEFAVNNPLGVHQMHYAGDDTSFDCENSPECRFDYVCLKIMDNEHYKEPICNHLTGATFGLNEKGDIDCGTLSYTGFTKK